MKAVTTWLSIAVLAAGAAIVIGAAWASIALDAPRVGATSGDAELTHRATESIRA